MDVRTITIECHGPNDFTVREGDRYADRLCWDEMLGQVVELTHVKIGRGRYPMLTEHEYADRAAARRRRAAESLHASSAASPE